MLLALDKVDRLLFDDDVQLKFTAKESPRPPRPRPDPLPLTGAQLTIARNSAAHDIQFAIKHRRCRSE